MKRTLCVAVEIEVSDLPPEAREDAAICEGVALNELPALKDAKLDELCRVVETAIRNNDEAFGGSMVYAAFTDAKVISSLWKRERPKRRRAA